MSAVDDLRSAHDEGRRPSARLADLRLADLSDANLLGAKLRGADLRGANLRGADLSDADLQGADLRGADLSNADLQGANLSGADLRGTYLRDADLWGGLRVDGLVSGQVTVVPTVGGWHVRVECWTGTPAKFRALVEGDTGWPQARGEEILRRRPVLLALADMIDAHAIYHDEALALVQEKWGDKK